ncbi:penicillin-binding transpeptidase domain-containing protein [Porticoccus litoralis]|uniref:Peptidoglycan D,D-transpeptidase FtsI n=1 Tax=Porticoccus litoralis TaxID=434086 RepID=A0AAW8B3G8_9GAMM|nr:penicillin-binding transpeptidase domain-containing protein [Porticoccus litoralis]MDP1520040.1 penicillin-binding transpeptidase domain-containing protein [Porticoccus litoralis]
MNRVKPGKLTISRWRYLLVVTVLATLPVAGLWHIAQLQVMPDVDKGYEFLQGQGMARTLRTESIPAYRGVITDRRGEPLAVSTPVVTLWANPQLVNVESPALKELAKTLAISHGELKQRLIRYAGKEFMYLERQLTPEQAEEALRLEIPGIYGQGEYKRFYPAGEVTSQLVGFTNIDDHGQEGMELAYDEWLTGVPGAKQVLKDLKGRVIKELGLLRSEKAGENLALSIDLRLQYTAYRELKEAVNKFQAASGSVVLLDARTGEVLAMANQPSFNPNDRGQLNSDALRNRAVTDLVEPGSTMKPLTVLAALESGKYVPETVIDTNPGYIRVGRKTFYDHRNYGVIDLTTLLMKSSQVGTTKIALDLEPEHIREMFARVGIGESPGTGFPGETPGSLPDHRRWRPVERANFAFGHGLSASALQIAQAYAVLANNGIKKPVTLLKTETVPEGVPVVDAELVAKLRTMMTSVTGSGGTATRAAIPAYEVAGKTGTVHKVGKNGYEKNRYVGMFAGMVPADNPRLVAVVVINDPKGGKYFGGEVAAPVFGNVVADALRMLKVPPQIKASEQVTSVVGKKSGGAT